MLSQHNSLQLMSFIFYRKFCMSNPYRSASGLFQCRPYPCIPGLFPCSRFIDGSLLSVLCSTSWFGTGPSFIRRVGLCYNIMYRMKFFVFRVTIGKLPVHVICRNVLFQSKSCFLGNSPISWKRPISRK